jgi:hypothetical protein
MIKKRAAMKTTLLTLSLLTLALGSSSARADCATQQTLCEARCSIEYFGEKAAKMGCESRCMAERAACSTGKGAEKAVEIGKKAWQDTGKFVEGFTGDDKNGD